MPKAVEKTRIAILVPNPCNPDYRIIKYAEIFNKRGYDVRVYCRWTPGLPSMEEINGILYIRSPIVTLAEFLKELQRKIISTESSTSRASETNESIRSAGVKNEDPNFTLQKINQRVISAPMYMLRKIKRNTIVSTILNLPRKLAAHINRTWAYKFQPTAFNFAHKKSILAWQPHVVHCHDWPTLELGRIIKSRYGSILIFDSHELETHRSPPLSPTRKKWMEAFERRLLPQCDIVSSVCDSASDYLEEEYKIARPRVIVNSPIFSPDLTPIPVQRWGRTPTINSVRIEANASPSDFLLVMVGNMTLNRGVETMLEAMPLLPKNVKVALVGKTQSNFKATIERMIQKFSDFDHVKFVEPVNPVSLVDFLSSANAGIIPIIPITLSYEYALPNKLFECAFAGIPIIASNTTELRKAVKNFDLGTTFEPGNHRDLAEKILQLMKTQSKMNAKTLEFIHEMKFENAVDSLLTEIGKRTIKHKI